MPRTHLPAWLTALALTAAPSLGDAAPRVERSLPFPQLGCSVEGIGSEHAAERFCQGLGRSLERPMQPVADAREVTRGEAIHVFHTDVSLIVALVRDGQVVGFTRLSKGLVVRKHVDDVATAARALMLHAPEPHEASCIRLEHPGHAPRDPDLLYPWAEFEHCDSHMLEIAQPWQ